MWSLPHPIIRQARRISQRVLTLVNSPGCQAHKLTNSSSAGTSVGTMAAAAIVLSPITTPSDYHRIVSPTLTIPTDATQPIPVGLLSCQRQSIARLFPHYQDLNHCATRNTRRSFAPLARDIRSRRIPPPGRDTPETTEEGCQGSPFGRCCFAGHPP